ncbi:hypothetical protein ACIBSS_30860 [Micromonospora aurantiaca]|uniref:hypothetical protein n=1 Tax=Micromonospora aurantiaca (nom. illeg.) TaxID=47850 RepID=UPI0033CDEA51
MAITGAYDEQVVQRMLEMCHPATPWWRRLWQPGTALLARELLEAGDPAMSASDHARDTLLAQLRERAMRDPGCGPARQRSATGKLLPAKSASIIRPGHSWFVLEQYTDALRARYLTNWASELRKGAAVSGLSAEATSRLLLAHLLDEGCSEKFVHRWLTYHARHDSTRYQLADLLDLLAARLSQPAATIEVLVPLAAEVVLPRPVPAGWLTAIQARRWRAANIPGASPMRQHGALVLTVTAHDIYAAADLARDRVSALVNKFSLGARRELIAGNEMWLKGVPKPEPLNGSIRRVEIRSIERREQLWSHRIPRNLEAALELMAPLKRGPIPAAITGAWAAIEGLLIGPGDQGKHIAAERIALITGCAFVRAEMTSLAWAHQRAASDQLSADIRDAATNKERARLAIHAASSGHLLALPREEDRNGLVRIRSLIQDPYEFVNSVTKCLDMTFAALYRQRNALAHAGGTDAVALHSTLSRTAPLVAAGIDRIADAVLKEGISPLELAARAKLRLDELRGRHAANAVDLLS